MDIPAKVSIFNRALDIKSKQGTLISVSEHGFYEVILDFEGRNHTVLLPVAETVLVFVDAVPAPVVDFDVER